MKALSVKQPWAAGIALKDKTIETRTWSTKYRGPLLICSSLKADSIDSMRASTLPGVRFSEVLSLSLGMALCVVDLVDCRPMTKEDEEAACCRLYDGAWAWVLDNVRPLKPFPVKGSLGIWNYQGECDDCDLSHREICEDRNLRKHGIMCHAGGTLSCLPLFKPRCPDWYPADSLFALPSTNREGL